MLSKYRERKPPHQLLHELVSARLLAPNDWYDEEGQHCSYDVGENKEAVDYLTRLRDAVKLTARTKNPPWSEARGRWVISREARVLWSAFRGIGLAPKALGRESQMHPYLRVGFRLGTKWYPRLRFFATGSGSLGAEEYPRRMMAHIVRVIRRVCSTKKFKRRIAGMDRQYLENYKACAKYFLSLLREHARLLTLRVDLYLEAEGKEAAREGEIEVALEKFIRNLRQSRITPHVLGYIIKREDAYDRGIHLHVMVMIDGHKHFRSYKLAEIIRLYWIHSCVGSPTFGSGFNCYLRKDSYLYNGIGLVHYTDGNMLRGVRDMLHYLTKTDGHFLVPKSFGKNLRKGQTPDSGAAKRGGALRKLGTDMSEAERILLRTMKWSS